MRTGASLGWSAMNTAADEHVILVDESGARIGLADKRTVHSATTPLHLAFSCHVFDAAGRVLVTRRSLQKLTWPGVWTNSFCGHPGADEPVEDAIARRAERELGLTVREIELVVPDFRYRATDASGIVENEVCPVYRAVAASPVDPRPDEVAEYAWVSPDTLRTAVLAAPYAFSPWLALQLQQWDFVGV
jgi:isopentenyl-diphosphate delta-isomerase